MASVEFINKRIEGKRKEIAKLEKKLERIKKAQATNWTVNPYWYNESDLRSAEKDLVKAKESLASYERELSMEEEKANSRNVPAIIEFLNRWKDSMYNLYKETLDACYEEKTTIREMREKLCLLRRDAQEYKELEMEYKRIYTSHCEKLRGTYEERECVGYNGRKTSRSIKVKDGIWEWASEFANEKNVEDALMKVDKMLKREWELKYDDIVERCNAICGQIVDASNLSVGAKGELNGFVIGSRGNASVKTIGAGGYAVQCFHFRTLIHKI